MADPVSLTPEVEFSRAPTDASSNSASLSDTPPTTVADSVSLASDHSKSEQTPLLELDHAVHVAHQQEHGAEPADAPTHHEDEPRQEALYDHDDDAAEAAEGPSATRPRRARASLPVYNLSKLAGTDVHGKRRSKGDVVSDRRRRTISGDTLVNQAPAGGEARDSVESSIEATGSGSPARKKNKEDNLVEDSINALDMDWSVRRLNTPRGSRSPRKKGQYASASASPAARHIATRRSGASAETLATKLSSLGKRGRKTFEKGITRMSRELRRLQDTNEFAHIDTKPVRHTVWSNGKYVDPDAPAEEEPPRKRVKTEEEPASVEAAPAKTTLPGQRRAKTWLNKGLYAGQDLPADMTKSLTMAEKKAIAQIPELAKPAPPNKSLPFPVYNGMRTLITGRDFKLPYDVCNPLPPGQPKPDEWRKMTRNRFIGDAKQIWIQNSDFKEYQSKCVCKPEDGCAETCQNRSMLYECDEHNCNIGREFCTNRQFKDLQERTKKGGRYRVGVEVLKTEDRGFGIRANRCFEPYQIIMEYTGEIITNEECENRMNEIYKDNKCYYLMSFDQNMIIDATTGSIARFVNHSCSPNCHMIKWIVSGQPRMALFAGSRPIMTGDELTYDYKFDPFSAKSVQKCLCGSPNCRGVLGPKPKEDLSKKKEVTAVKKEGVKTAVKATVRAGKRKLKELLDGPSDDEDEKKAAKKRKTAAASAKAKAAATATGGGIKRSLSSASLKAAKGAAKGAATVIRRSVSTISVNARARLSSGSGAGSLKKKKAAPSPRTVKGAPGKKITATATATATIRKSSSTSVLKTYGKQGKKMGAGSSPASSRKVAARRSVEVSASRNSSLTIVASNSSEETGTKKQHPLAKSKSTTDLGGVSSAASTPVSTKSGRVVKRRSFDDDDEDGRSRAPTPTPGSGSGSSSRPRAGIEIARVEAQIRVVQADE